jgi:hypothetical protein
MKDEQRAIQTTVLKIRHNDLAGEPFETLVKIISKAWESIPPECRASSGFEIEMSELTVPTTTNAIVQNTNE